MLSNSGHATTCSLALLSACIPRSRQGTISDRGGATPQSHPCCKPLLAGGWPACAHLLAQASSPSKEDHAQSAKPWVHARGAGVRAQGSRLHAPSGGRHAHSGSCLQLVFAYCASEPPDLITPAPLQGQYHIKLTVCGLVRMWHCPMPTCEAPDQISSAAGPGNLPPCTVCSQLLGRGLALPGAGCNLSPCAGGPPGDLPPAGLPKLPEPRQPEHRPAACTAWPAGCLCTAQVGMGDMAWAGRRAGRALG